MLLDAIRAWDGKSAQDIGDIYKAHVQAEGFEENIVSALTDKTAQSGASWLLKHHLEQGAELPASLQDQVFTSLRTQADWPSKLHLLQCFPYLSIPTEARQASETFLRQTLADPNKFIRAWSYNGFYLLACRFPQYQAEVQSFLELAMLEEAASVKARVRKLLKRGFQ